MAEFTTAVAYRTVAEENFRMGKSDAGTDNITFRSRLNLESYRVPANSYPVTTPAVNWIFIREDGTFFAYGKHPIELINESSRPTEGVSRNDLGFQNSNGTWWVFTSRGWEFISIVLIGWAIREEDGSCRFARGVTPRESVFSSIRENDPTTLENYASQGIVTESS